MTAAGEIDALGNPLIHDQVMASKGFRVDTGLKELLELLWAAGLSTEYSCQCNDRGCAYIAFPSQASDWYRFVIGTVGPAQANIVVSQVAGVLLASWSHHLTPMITDAWRQQ
jgi:hypothetical protein